MRMSASICLYQNTFTWNRPPSRHYEFAVYTSIKRMLSVSGVRLITMVIIYYIKLQFSLSVCTPPFFSTRPSDRNQIWHTYSGRYGTHSELKKYTHPTPEGSHGGVGGFLGGHKIKSPGNVMNCPENPKKIQNPVGGWGGVEVLGGQKIKSPGSVMNCPEKKKEVKPRGWGGSFRGKHFMNCRENR